MSEMGLGVVVGCVLMLLSANSNADVFQWKDEQGRTHFGDKVPQGANAQSVQVPVADSSGAADTGAMERQERQRKIVDILSAERKEREEKRKKALQKKKKKQKNCQRFKQRIENSKRMHVYYEYNDKDERVYLSDKQRKAIDQKRMQKYQAKCG